MPFMGGRETAQLLRQNNITNVPILIISANAGEREVNPQEAVLSEDFMLKPIDLNLLLSKIGDKLGLSWIDDAKELPPLAQQPTDSLVLTPISPILAAQPESEMRELNNKTINHAQNLPQALQHLDELIGQGYIRGIQQALKQYLYDFPEQAELWEQISQLIRKFDLKQAQRLIQDKQ